MSCQDLGFVGNSSLEHHHLHVGDLYARSFWIHTTDAEAASCSTRDIPWTSGGGPERHRRDERAAHWHHVVTYFIWWRSRFSRTEALFNTHKRYNFVLVRAAHSQDVCVLQAAW